MVKVKLTAALALLVIVLVVIFQNTEAVDTKFLFVTLTMPRAALLGITMLVGVVIGILIALAVSFKKSKEE